METNLDSKQEFRVDYEDIFSCAVQAIETPPERIVEISLFTWPKWVHLLFRLRDILVAPFGLRRGGKIENNLNLSTTDKLQQGDMAGFFTVMNRTDTFLNLRADDSHLCCLFQIVLSPAETNVTIISLRTAVQFNNFLGKVYFAVIKPFHCAIVQVMIRKIKRDLA